VTHRLRVHGGTGEHRRQLRDIVRTLPRQVLLPAVAIYALIVAVGLLFTGVLDEYVVEPEDAVARGLAANRSDGWTAVTGVFSTLASTGVIIATMVVTAGVLRLVFKRWREAVMIITAVSLQVVIFLLTAAVIDRERPDVSRLDPAPPTSSFPSGHVGASTALYLGIALLVAWHLRGTALRTFVIAALISIPLAVAASRLYRGMHHPTDVIVGSLNGIACLAVAVRAYRLGQREQPRRA
jgi:undecaprenyl-diphosphatase